MFFGLEYEGAMAVDIKNNLFPNGSEQDNRIETEAPLLFDLKLGKDNQVILKLSVNQISEVEYADFLIALYHFSSVMNVWKPIPLKDRDINENIIQIDDIKTEFEFDKEAVGKNKLYFSYYLANFMKVLNPEILFTNRHLADISLAEFRNEISSKHLKYLYQVVCQYTVNLPKYLSRSRLIRSLMWYLKYRKIFKLYDFEFIKKINRDFEKHSLYKILQKAQLDQLIVMAEALVRYNNFIPKKKIDWIVQLAMMFTQLLEGSTKFVSKNWGSALIGENNVVFMLDD